MERQTFRPTEYVAPLILVLLVSAGIGWLMVRLWRQASTAPPEPRPGISDYRLPLNQRN